MSNDKQFIPVEMAYNRVDAKFSALTWAVHQSHNADEALTVIDDLMERLTAMAEALNKYKSHQPSQKVA